MRAPYVLALVVLGSAVPAGASEDDFRHGRIRYIEDGATLQRATEPGSEEATTNLPFLPGDRVWTDDRGRVEFQFADGSLVRLDSRSKLDYVAHDEGRGERVVLHLWSGGLMLLLRDGRDFPAFAVEVPGGLVESEDRVVLRIDVESGETRLSVHEGSATLDSGRRRVEVQAGERTYARRGEAPETPQRFDRGESDDFAAWNRERDERETWAGDSRRYLPEEVSPYAAELESHGDWYYETEVGYVWRPYVAAGWRPYLNGRWVWSIYGWTWVPYDPWGWAPFHYGRWGYSPALGWYWIPGSVWGPAWVSWAVGGDYVGWCPLGHRDRPVALGNRPREHAAPRGSVPGANTSAWVYARKADVGARDLARRRVEMRPAEAQTLKVVESPRARPSRDFLRVSEVAVPREGAGPRNISIKPTIGDTVPELRADPKTTIPAPVPRRRPRGAAEDVLDRDSSGGASKPSGARDAARERERPRWTPDQPTATAPAGEGRRPTDTRSPSGGSIAEPRNRARGEERARPVDPDPDRDVLRKIFRPLSEPRQRGGDVREAAPRSEPRTPPPPRSEPKRAAPPPPPPPPPAPAAHQAPRPHREKDK